MAQPGWQVLQQRENDVRVDFGGGNIGLFSLTPEKDVSEGGEPVYLTRVVSPVGSFFDVPRHWHPYSDEYFRVYIGEVIVYLSGKTLTVTPESGEVLIPRGAVHGVHVPKDIHCEVGERADPNPVRKMKFLHTLLSNGGQKTQLSPVQVMRLFWDDGDSYPGVGPFKFIGTSLLYVMGGFLGHVCGFGQIPEQKAS